MVIVVTGTIAPNGSQKYLKLSDANNRLLQYKGSLKNLINASPEANIVFSENSGYGIEAFQDLVSFADERGIKLEVLSFKGDSDAVTKHGKGYGEGEILEYVLNNSALMSGEEYFIKITGRLVVDNISKIASRVHKDRVYFNIPNIHRKEFYDTRLYAMPVEVFRRYFIMRYNKVNDSEGYFLEHAYTDAALENGLQVYNFPSYPRIVGESGSSGIRYGYKEWKSKIRDFLSVFNIYAKTSRGDRK